MLIENSHQRSRSYGLSEFDQPDFSLVAKADLVVAIEKNRILHTHALPVMETLYEQIINTHNMVILTDADGLIVHSLGDADFLEKADRVALKSGASWSESQKGTNAIGTAITEKLPIQIHAAEHYLLANQFLTCSAAPIFDHFGHVVGALDVTGDKDSFHKHTMALVRMSAQMIENHLFSATFQNSITLHFNTRAEFIGTLMEGIAAFSPDGRFLSANRVGLFQLGLSLSSLKSHTFSSLFGMPMSSLFDHYRTATPGLLSLCIPSGVRVFGKANVFTNTNLFQRSAELSRGDLPVKPEPTETEQKKAARAMSGLKYLNTGDAQMASLIDKVSKVLGRDIPILVLGETGTGKELLAQAMHNDSSRCKGPFVAVNCGSIPETLIESELFGYEEGAFTGAKKKGAIGKILQANGGTLFLDEIGDMPFPLQARLLRVLQERVVTPLGSTKSIPVNVELICATHRNLREQIANGNFREDLYYRLNGMVVKLPPLRERTDIDVIVEKILASSGFDRRHHVSDEVMRLFKLHKWPGNFRQLTNILRTATVIADEEAEIGIQHLPDDFLDDVNNCVQKAAENNDDLLDHGSNLKQLETAAVQKMLAANGGNVSAAARALGVSRNTIYRKIPGLK